MIRNSHVILFLMEIDPLKIPAFMRNKPFRKKELSNFLKASAPPSTSKPFVKIQLQPSFTPSPFTPSVSKPLIPRRVKPELVLAPVGVVTHYLDKIKVAIVKLGTDLRVGVRLQWVGKNGPFNQKLSSMQIDREQVENANRGQEVGIKVSKKVVIGEMVYLVN